MTELIRMLAEGAKLGLWLIFGFVVVFALGLSLLLMLMFVLG